MFGEIGTAITLVLLGVAHEAALAALASIIAGASWIAAIANLNISAQVSLPGWVRGHGLAMYVTVFFGSMTVGSTIWGIVATHLGLASAQLIAGTGALAAIPLTWRWKLQTGVALDYLRQHERVTNADRILQNKIHQLLRTEPVVTHLISPETRGGQR